MRARISTGAGWVDSDLAGVIQYGGERITFGPPEDPGGTVDEYLIMPPPLSSSDWYDAGANVGTRFGVSQAGDWVGIRVWRSNTTQNPGEYVFAGNGDTNVVLTPNTPVDSPIRNDFVTVTFAASVPVVPGVNYTAAYHTDRYGFSRVTDGAALPMLSASGRIYTDPAVMSAVAVYTYANGVVPTSSSPNFHFNVSPVVRFPA